MPIRARDALARLPPTTALSWLSGLAAGLSLFGFGVAGVFRLLYPYPMDGIEDASVQVLRRIVAGQQPYGPPSLEYVPVIYPPLYYYVSAALAALTGPTLFTLRLVSLVASLGCATIIYRLVKRETGIRVIGLVSASLFVGSSYLALTTLDLARVDALALLCVLAAIFAMRSADYSPWAAGRLSLLAGVLAGLSILTKQPSVVAAAALLAYAALSARTHLGPYVFGLGVTLAVGALALFFVAGDWAKVYLYDLPRSHEVDERHLANFWAMTLFPRFTLPLVAGPFFLVSRALRGQYRTVLFYGLTSVTLLGMTWAGWSNQGAATNVLVPAFAVLSTLFGLGIAEALGMVRGAVRDLVLVRAYLLALCLAQFVILGYNPRATIPLRSDLWAGDRLVATFAALPGRIFAPEYGEWSRRAGKGDQPASAPILETVAAFGGTPLPRLATWSQQLVDALRARKYAYILIDPDTDAYFLRGLAQDSGYVDIGPLFQPADEFYLWRTGLTPDARVFVPVEVAASAAGH